MSTITRSRIIRFGGYAPPPGNQIVSRVAGDNVLVADSNFKVRNRTKQTSESLVLSDSLLGGGSANVFTQGALFSVTGSSFGTRADHNTDDYTYEGHRHIHWRWMTFPNTWPSTSGTKAAFLTAFEGGFPAAEFEFNANYTSLNLNRVSGGPSQSGFYVRKISNGGFAEGGYIESDTDTNPPDSPIMFCTWKYRDNNTSGGRKIWRRWKDGQPSTDKNWYVAGQGINSEDDGYWLNTIQANAFKSFDTGGTTWVRLTIKQNGGTTGTTFAINGTVQDYEAYHNDIQILPRPTGLPCMRPTSNNRGCLFSWPNSSDSGCTQDQVDIYQDWTLARVEVTGANGKVEIQPCFSWADSGLVIICNQGEMGTGAATLRAYNASDSVIHTQSITVV